jgi:N-acyl-phosphatidylethanolamine-hydrolysing phospholipase D
MSVERQAFPSHHVPGGFLDPDHPEAARSFVEILKWRWRVWREGLPHPARTPTPRLAADLGLLAADMSPSATWIGHSTALIRAGGLTFLTDPIFSERASPSPLIGPKRVVAPGIALADLPPIDVVLISHGHYDHLDRASIEALAARGPGRTLFITPLGYTPLLRNWGVERILELDWWQETRVGDVDIILTPARHWTARGLRDRNRMLWGAYAVFAPDFAWYFSGDTGYGRHFAATTERLAGRRHDGALFDLALLSIGAYDPRTIMADHHMTPEEAVAAHVEIGARRSIAIHWGTFALTDEALDEPPERLAAALDGAGIGRDRFRALAVGETWWLGRP